jgi:hypothetical protein
LEAIDDLDLDDLEEEVVVQEEDNQQSKREAVKRKKKADKDADSFKKQVLAANNIALACQWVLEQLSTSRITESASPIFDESHFQAVQLTANEVSWLKAHESIEKVLHLTCIAYAAAPKWEPYPHSILSVQDLEKIESERFAHRRAIEEANRIATQLLVRKADNIDPTQQIIEFGFRNAEYIKNRLSQAKSNAKEKKKKKDTVSTISNAIDDQHSSTAGNHDGVCDIVECRETAVGLCIATNNNCGKYRFCSMHIAHSSHHLHKTKDNTAVI